MTSTNGNVDSPRPQSPLKHTARYTLSVQSRTGDHELIYTLGVECNNTLRACFCGDLDEERLAERLDAMCGHRHQFRMTDGLASRLPGHRKYVEWLRRSDENSWLKAAREEREQDGRVSVGTERVCLAIRARRAAAKKAAAAERMRVRARQRRPSRGCATRASAAATRNCNHQLLTR